MDPFKIIYMLLGGLGIFFFGMKLMSDGLQVMAGDVIRKIINSLTANRIMAVGVGIVVTCIVQSSSVTTVMSVGFVNAGLMTLKQAIGIIFGANIGTTITGWIISVKVGKYGLLFVAAGFMPGLFSKNNYWQQIGKAVMGIGFIFIGLVTMSNAFIPLRESPEFLDSIAYFAGDNYGAYIASIMMGCLLTVVVQSSSAMLGITIALASTGIITYHTAVALVLGENIGTTITALLASVGANVNAKRAARAHACFNLFGVSFMLLILPWYFDLVDWIVPNDPNFQEGDGARPFIAQHIAMAHSIFNISATVLFLPFVDTLATFVTRITKDRSDEKEIPHLLMLGPSQDMPVSTGLLQAEKETLKMADITQRMSLLVNQYWKEDKPSPKKLEKIISYEEIIDNIHKEVTIFLGYVMERPMSRNQSKQTQALIKVVDEMESVADYLERLAVYRGRFKKDETLEGESQQEFFDFMDEVNRFFDSIVNEFNDVTPDGTAQIKKKSDDLQVWADSIRDKHLERISKRVYKPITALTFSDMVVALRKIRTHSYNMSKSIEVLKTSVD